MGAMNPLRRGKKRTETSSPKSSTANITRKRLNPVPFGPGDIFGLTPFFIQRKVRMAEWDLSAVGKKCPDCRDDAFRARLPN
jgi:hypothetical protein